MIIGKTIRVRCSNTECSRRAIEVNVALEQVAPSVVAVPKLLCLRSNCEMIEVKP